jgi:hypothetical protein
VQECMHRLRSCDDFRLTCGSQTLDGIFGKDTGPGGRTPSLYSITCQYANQAKAIGLQFSPMRIVYIH